MFRHVRCSQEERIPPSLFILKATFKQRMQQLKQLSPVFSSSAQQPEKINGLPIDSQKTNRSHLVYIFKRIALLSKAVTTAQIIRRTTHVGRGRNRLDGGKVGGDRGIGEKCISDSSSGNFSHAVKTHPTMEVHLIQDRSMVLERSNMVIPLPSIHPSIQQSIFCIADPKQGRFCDRRN